MFSIDRWQEIFQAIAKNKLRTFLTGISVASGIFILVILLGAGKGMENGMAEQFGSDTQTSLSIWANRTSMAHKGLNPNRPIQFHNDDYDFISEQFAEQIEVKSAVNSTWGKTFLYADSQGDYQINGCTKGTIEIDNASIEMGRDINHFDQQYAKKVIVIGGQVKTDLFKDKNPLGEYLYVNSIPFKVIGVFSKEGSRWGERMGYAPLSTVQKAFGLGDELTNVAIKLNEAENYEEMVSNYEMLSKTLLGFLKNKHVVNPEDEMAIRVHSSFERSKGMYQRLFMIKLFFWWVGICTIIGGVVGVSNIMLIIVKERTKEIGIRKALGAQPSAIIGMIMQEAIFITAISGFVGLLLSLGVLELVGPMITHDFFINPSVDFAIAIITIMILMVAGALAGFVPAYKAAKIKPIEALRDE